MSYSKDVKLEIIKKNNFEGESLAIIQGLILSAGSLVISDGRLSFVVSNELKEVILLLKDKLIQVFGEDIEIEICQVVKNFKQKERFELSVKGDFNEVVLEKLGIIKRMGGDIKISDDCIKNFMKSKNSMMALLTGLFLGSGSVSVPTEKANKKSYGYHFEISLGSKTLAEATLEIFSNFDIFPKMIERNENFIVYLKNCDTICDALGMFGASKTVLDVLSQRVARDMNSVTNRQMNCYQANVDKTVTAAVEQMKAIDVIMSTIGIENLPDSLAEAVLARLANPEGSLKELLLTLDSKISKGALAQRFKKIIALAKELGEEDEK